VSQPGGARPIDKIVGDILDAATAAAEIVARGREAWNADRLLRLAAEAVISRIGDAAGKLPEEVRSAMPTVAWDAIRDNRILVAHIYHRIDPDIMWATLSKDVPRLAAELERWRELGPSRDVGTDKGIERDTGLEIGF
jgi:uncharacterized protein with HEPN domain